MNLQLNANFSDAGKRYHHEFSPADDFYEALIDSHHGLSDQQSSLFNAKLILLLANHIGDLQVLQQALQLAREDL